MISTHVINLFIKSNYLNDIIKRKCCLLKDYFEHLLLLSIASEGSVYGKIFIMVHLNKKTMFTNNYEQCGDTLDTRVFIDLERCF